jgi:hypothetical protein
MCMCEEEKKEEKMGEKDINIDKVRKGVKRQNEG